VYIPTAGTLALSVTKPPHTKCEEVEVDNQGLFLEEAIARTVEKALG
jgi:hypothetical protein